MSRAVPDRDPPFKKISFTVDAALLRELGERLVGRPQVALAELVKNSYDADANSCRIVLGPDAIEVIDDGNGMTADEFKRFWMRVGTTHKQQRATSPRFGRVITGSKGVGRLSVQFLGSQLEMWTVARGSDKALHARIDWATTHGLRNLTQAAAEYRIEGATDKISAEFSHGTRLVIRGLNQLWNETELRDLARELWFLQPPKQILDEIPDAHRFNVTLEGVGEGTVEAFEEQMLHALGSWSAKISGRVDQGRTTGLAKVRLEFADGEVFREKYPLPNQALNHAHFTIRIFKLSGRQSGGISVKDAREYFKRYGGVHVYDDNFRLPFYGGADQDWLRLEYDHSHRLLVSKLLPEALQVPGGMQDLPTLGRVFGIVHVSTSAERRAASQKDRDRGAFLNVQVTRDRLIDNGAFQDLVHLVRWAFDFYAHRTAERKRRIASRKLDEAGPRPSEALIELQSAIAGQEARLPTEAYESITEKIDAVIEATKGEQERVDNERILLGALATAGMSALALEHELGKEVTSLSANLEDLRKLAQGPLNAELSSIVESIEGWIERAKSTRLMFSPLMNEIDREQHVRMRARRAIGRVAHLMSPLLRKVVPEAEDVPEDLKLPRSTMAAWNAIFQNIFMNSINAMLDSNEKRIRCYGDNSSTTKVLVVEDTGVGVDLQTADELFKPFVRRLEISDERRALGLGGVGLGLTIVRMVASTLGCEVSFVPPRKGFKTAIRMEWEDKT